jgi:hypothetical protein
MSDRLRRATQIKGALTAKDVCLFRSEPWREFPSGRVAQFGGTGPSTTLTMTRELTVHVQGDFLRVDGTLLVE